MYVYKTLKSNDYKNLFFIFLFQNALSAKLSGKTFAKKHHCIFSRKESFIERITFNFHSINKFNDFVAAQYATTMFFIHAQP